MTMTMTSFDTYRSARLAEGFDEVAERFWPADSVAEMHTHPFAVQALVVQGEMWLTVGEQTRHLQPGDRFDLARELPHAERYGPAGATYWAARRYVLNNLPCTSPRHQTPSSGPTAECAPQPPSPAC